MRPRTHARSWVALPGLMTLSDGAQVIAYLFSLFYLFLGIAIVADLFMG